MNSIAIAPKAPRQPAAQADPASSKSQGAGEFSRMVSEASAGQSKGARQGVSNEKAAGKGHETQAPEADQKRIMAGRDDVQAVGPAERTDGPKTESNIKARGETADSSIRGSKGTPIGGLGGSTQQEIVAGSRDGSAVLNQDSPGRAVSNRHSASNNDTPLITPDHLDDGRLEDTSGAIETSTRPSSGPTGDGLWITEFRTNAPAKNQTSSEADRLSVDAAVVSADQATVEAKSPDGGRDDASAERSPRTSTPALAVMAVAPFLNAKAAMQKPGETPVATRPQSDRANAASSKAMSADTTGRGMAAQRDDVIKAAFGRSAEGTTIAKAQPDGGDLAGQSKTQAAATATAPANGPLPPMPATDGVRASIPTIPVDLSRLPGTDSESLGAARELVASHVARITSTPNPGQPVPVLRLQLQPAHLGQINVTMRMVDGTLAVQMTPDSEAAARVLTTDRDSLVATVRALGGGFANASIEVGGDTFMRQSADDGAQSRSAGSDLREGAGGDQRGSEHSAGDLGFGGWRDGASALSEQGADATNGSGRIII